MIFKIRTVGNFYNSAKERERLSKLGFTFKQTAYGIEIQGSPEIEINSLEDLLNFSKEYGQLVIEGDLIEIFDDYY